MTLKVHMYNLLLKSNHSFPTFLLKTPWMKYCDAILRKPFDEICLRDAVFCHGGIFFVHLGHRLVV